MTKAEASRHNGALSQGPTTPEGKQRSAQNSLKHGLQSQRVVLPDESAEDFDALLFDYIRLYMPVGAIEKDLVDEIAANRWRIRRCMRYETSALEQASAKAAEQLGPDATPSAIDALVLEFTMGPKSTVRALHRNEARLRRACERADRELRRIQDARLAPVRAQAAAEAEEAAAKKLPNEPIDHVEAWVQACLRQRKPPVTQAAATLPAVLNTTAMATPVTTPAPK